MSRTMLLFTALTAAVTACQPTSSSGGAGTEFRVTDRSAAVEIDGRRTGVATATCLAGEEAVGGGFGIAATRYTKPITSLPANQFVVVDNYPESRQSWTVRVLNRDVDRVLVTAHVECISRGVGAQIATGDARPAGEQSIAQCPAGSRLATGGGWRISGISGDRVVNVVRSLPALDPPRWGITTWPAAKAVGTETIRHTAYGVCATTGLAYVATRAALATAPNGTIRSKTPVDATTEFGCSEGDLLTGAGYRAVDRRELSLTTFFPRAGTPPAWVLTVYSLPGQTVDGGPSVAGVDVWLQSICARVDLLPQPAKTYDPDDPVRRGTGTTSGSR